MNIVSTVSKDQFAWEINKNNSEAFTDEAIDFIYDYIEGLDNLNGEENFNFSPNLVYYLFCEYSKNESLNLLKENKYLFENNDFYDCDDEAIEEKLELVFGKKVKRLSNTFLIFK